MCLKPDWRKASFFVFLMVWLQLADIETYAFGKDIPGGTPPPLYDILGRLGIDAWSGSVLLMFPLYSLPPLKYVDLTRFPGLGISGLYLYLLSSLLFCAHDAGGHRLGKMWRWMAWAAPAIFYGFSLVIGGGFPLRTVQDIVFVISSAGGVGIAISLYLYLLVSIGWWAYLRVRHRWVR